MYNGETGLDYYWSTENKKAQQDSLARHISHQRLKKPLVIHMRDAKEDTIDILKAEGARRRSSLFAENWETAKKALDFSSVVWGLVSFKTQQIKDVTNHA